MNKYKKLFSNSAAMAVGQFSSKALSFLLVPLYTAVLSTEEYGTYDLIITTVTMLTPFLTLVISESVMRFCMDKGHDSGDVFSIGTLITLIGTLVLTAFYPLLCRIEAIGNRYAIWIIIFFLVINIHTVFTQYLKGIEKVVFYSICGIISTALSLVMCIVFLLVFKWSITGYFLATVLSHLLVIILIFFKEKLYKRIRNPFRIPKATYKAMLNFSVPMIPNSISWWISNSSSKYVLLYYVTASAVGIYSVAYKIPSVLSIVITIFVSALQISIFESFGDEDSKDFFKGIYSGFSSVNIVVSSILILISEYIAVILYQKEFYSAWKVSCIIIFAYIFHSLSAIIGTVYSAAKKTKFLFVSTCAGAVANVIVCILLVPSMGIEGAAIALVVSYILVWILRLVDARRRFSYKLNILSDVVSYILVIGQIVLVYFDVNYSKLISAALTVVICVLNLRQILKMEIVARILGKIKNKLIKRT